MDDGVTPGGRSLVRFPTGVLQQLQQLTYLELAEVGLQGPDDTSPYLQPLTALTRLADLRLAHLWLADLYPFHEQRVTAGMLSGMCHLTRMALDAGCFEPAALAGIAQLRNLKLVACTAGWCPRWCPQRLRTPSNASGLAELLSQLQHLQQLSHLDLRNTIRDYESCFSLAAAYAALTASSKLQHLSISQCTLPAGVWQHLFPAGRQLLHLTSLDFSAVKEPDLDDPYPAPDYGRVVSCCPNLQSLNMVSLAYNTQQELMPLRGLSGLHTLHLVTGTGHFVEDGISADTGEALQALCQLTGVRKLHLGVYDDPTPVMLAQLQQLPQLTELHFSGGVRPAVLKQEVSHKDNAGWVLRTLCLLGEHIRMETAR
jgi:hypothetical protein